MADLSTLQTRLSEAEAARHKLLTGSTEESVGHGDMRVTYTRAEAARLDAYIASLRAEIASLGGTVSGERRRGLTVDL